LRFRPRHRSVRSTPYGSWPPRQLLRPWSVLRRSSCGRPVGDRLLNTLKAERERLGLTQAALAEAVSVSRKTINTVENGIFLPSTVLALKLARALGRPVERLFQLND